MASEKSEIVRYIYNEFLPLGKLEKETIEKMIKRKRVHDSMLVPNGSRLSGDKMEVAYSTDGRNKFTEAAILRRHGKWTYLHLGSSKRLTYQEHVDSKGQVHCGDATDRHSDETGRVIAFKRALGSAPIKIRSIQ